MPQEGVPVGIDNKVHVAERIFWAGDWVDGPVSAAPRSLSLPMTAAANECRCR